MYEMFKHGSSWIRADFHLHTIQDKEFKFSGDEKKFIPDYVKELKKTNIRVGAITNHNKFDFNEFKTLRKKTLDEEIFLMPGVELSIKDGSSGIHTLVIFSDKWIYNRENTDYINNFLNLTFAGQSNYDKGNARSNHDILETIRELDKIGRDFFLLFAHVEADNGLWGGLSGGRIQDLGGGILFKQRTLGFQKVRTRDDRNKVKGWLKGWYPAEIEGSDCKTIEEIKQGKACYLKIGDFTFEAVKFSLLDYNARISQELKSYQQSYIHSITFEGGVLDKKTVRFSPELNGLIGIRGSGKSSIIEAVRYVLNISLDDETPDRDYKNKLVQHTLGSGGKAIIKAISRHGQEYEIRRILNEMPDVYTNGELEPGVKVRETILHKPIYFGQKDLTRTGEGFEKDLVEKLVGDKLDDVRRKIEDQRQRVFEIAERIRKLDNVDEQTKEYEIKKQDAEHRLKIFKEHGVEDKLQKQIDFDADARKIKQVIDFIKEYLSALAEFIGRFEDDFNNIKIYTSKQNKQFFKEFFNRYERLAISFSTHNQSLIIGNEIFSGLTEKAKEFDELKKGLKDEFAEIERKLSEELKDSGAHSIRPDEFLKMRKTVDLAKQMLESLGKQQSQKTALRDDLIKEITVLNDFWHEEFKKINSEIDKINVSQPALMIQAEYKGDKDAFVAYTKDVFRGSRIRDNTYRALADSFADFGAMYRDLHKAKKEAGNYADVFETYFMDNLKSLITWQVPNRFIIKYRDKELKDHSLGQRASALILFVLSQRENDIIIIDQPEDDLDNQTIYEDVIKLIRKIKPETQFIFATHNANFPVLGDAEQIHSCRYSGDKIDLKSGSIDCPVLQKEIVDIMEGGEEAFNRRKEIYRIWNPQNSLK